jgi:hypothetical protein
MVLDGAPRLLDHDLGENLFTHLAIEENVILVVLYCPQGLSQDIIFDINKIILSYLISLLSKVIYLAEFQFSAALKDMALNLDPALSIWDFLVICLIA